MDDDKELKHLLENTKIVYLEDEKEKQMAFMELEKKLCHENGLSVDWSVGSHHEMYMR
jgi:hypothetical protein